MYNYIYNFFNKSSEFDNYLSQFFNNKYIFFPFHYLLKKKDKLITVEKKKIMYKNVDLIITNNINYYKNSKFNVILFSKYNYYKYKYFDIDNINKYNIRNKLIKKKIILYTHFLNSRYLYKNIIKKNIIKIFFANNYILSPFFREQSSIQIYFYIILFAILRLNKKGIIIQTIQTCLHKSNADIILIFKKYFKKVEIIYDEKSGNVKVSGLKIIYKGFKGIPKKDVNDLIDIFDKMYKYDPTSHSFNIKNKKIREKYKIKTLITNYSVFKYPSNILNLKDTSNEYKFICKFNEKNYLNKTLYFYKIIEYIRLGYSEDNIPIHIKEHQFVKSYLSAIKYDYKIIDLTKDKFFNPLYKKLDQLIVNDMYEYNKPLIYEFKNNIKNEDNLYKDSDDFLFIKSYEMEIMNNMIKDIKWKKKNNLFYKKYYKDNSLLNIIKNKYIDYFDINNTWFDLYHIFSNINIINNNKIFNTYHISDTPTNDINVTNYYIKNNTNIKEYNWKIHSFNNKDYGIISNMKNNITYSNKIKKLNSIENIEYYKESLKKYNLLIINNIVDIKDKICQLVFIFNNLKKNGNFIYKYKLPIINELEKDLIYHMYLQFKSIYFVKPLSILDTNYIYIVGLNYKPIINNKELKNILNLVDNYSEKKLKTRITNKKYSDKYIKNLTYGLNKIINELLFDKERQIFYINYQNIIDNKLLKLIDKNIINKNNKFIKINKMKILKKKDRLLSII